MPKRLGLGAAFISERYNKKEAARALRRGRRRQGEQIRGVIYGGATNTTTPFATFHGHGRHGGRPCRA